VEFLGVMQGAGINSDSDMKSLNRLYSTFDVTSADEVDFSRFCRVFRHWQVRTTDTHIAVLCCAVLVLPCIAACHGCQPSCLAVTCTPMGSFAVGWCAELLLGVLLLVALRRVIADGCVAVSYFGGGCVALASSPSVASHVCVCW
jgi:hypothetical protein